MTPKSQRTSALLVQTRTNNRTVALRWIQKLKSKAVSLSLLYSLAIASLITTVYYWNNIESNFRHASTTLQESHQVFFCHVPNTTDYRVSEHISSASTIIEPIASTNCSPTAQVKIFLVPSDGKYHMQSIDDKGNPKTVGGDEFYVSYHEGDLDHPTAVASVQDMNDGSYILDFVEVPLPFLHPIDLENSTTTPDSTLVVNFQYTCFIGHMTPPSKANWTHGGSSLVSHAFSNFPKPPVHPFQKPVSAINLSAHDYVYAFGDSVMEQFVRAKTKSDESPKNLDFHRNVGRPFSSTELETLWRMFLQGGDAKLKAASNGGIIMGSAAWDILSDAAMSEGVSFCNETARELIRRVRKRYPTVPIYWKSPTALHNHMVRVPRTLEDIKRANRHFDLKTANWYFVSRVKYMSTSRVEKLYHEQKDLMSELNVSVMDTYEASYLSADWLVPGDGRHYQSEFNGLMLSWFYK